MTHDGTTPDPDPADRVRESVGHLQAAATELIAAARVLLDAAEVVVADPSAAAGLFSVLGDMARASRSDGTDGDDFDDGDDGGVQRIPVT